MNRIRQLIRRHGGTVAVAEKSNQKKQTVSNWIARQSIPVRHWGRLISGGVTREELINAHLEPEEEEPEAA